MEPPILQSLELLRYRSFVKDKVSFANPTFLVGRNGAGKSNLRDALAFLAEAMSMSLSSVLERRGGIKSILHRGASKTSFGLAVEIGPIPREITGATYAFKVRTTKQRGFEVQSENCRVDKPDGTTFWFERDPKTFRTNVQSLKPSLEPVSLGLPIIGGEASFSAALRTLAAIRCYAIEPAKLREPQERDHGMGLRADGSNAASILQEIGRAFPDDLARIGELLTTIVPNTAKVRPIKHGRQLTLEFTQEWGQKKRVKFESSSMSDGTLRAIGLLAAVYQQPPPSVLVIEEPEATMHPGALGAILDLLRHASRFMQVIVTTHSPEVLDADWLRDEHLRIVTWEEGVTRVLPLASGAREALQEHLMGAGELLRSNALWPAPVEPGTVLETSLPEDGSA